MRWNRRLHRPRAILRAMSSRCSKTPADSWRDEVRATRAAARARGDVLLVAEAATRADAPAQLEWLVFARMQGRGAGHVGGGAVMHARVCGGPRTTLRSRRHAADAGAALEADTSVVMRMMPPSLSPEMTSMAAAAGAVGVECSAVHVHVHAMYMCMHCSRTRIPFVFPPRSRLHGMSWSVD